MYSNGRFGYLAAEEEDPGEAGGGDAAPDDDGRGEQRPVAVDHPRFFLDFSLGLASLLQVVVWRPGSIPMSMEGEERGGGFFFFIFFKN